MKYRQAISILVLLITIFTLPATVYAVLSDKGPGSYKFESIFGQSITIYGKGLYRHDSVAMAVQAIAQDYVTLFLGVPLLIISLLLARRGLLKGQLMLTGTLGYFLYTYTSYSFLSMYNSFFLIYVSLMALSLYAFILSMMSFDIPGLSQAFSKKIPVMFIGSFLIFASAVFGIMWLGKIIPPLIHHEPPAGIDHYTTLVIQALDLGIVVPAGILSGILLIKRTPIGYLLSSVIITKEITLLTALSAMVIIQKLSGITVPMAIFWIILFFNILVIFCMYLILKGVKELEPGTERVHLSF